MATVAEVPGNPRAAPGHRARGGPHADCAKGLTVLSGVTARPRRDLQNTAAVFRHCTDCPFCQPPIFAGIAPDLHS
ncbi:Uncharacterised protein [Mycolicibacterium thermoresistibile]|jgi:hypothetical protein|uniref:GK10133 n=1 Tax=Mycolicibacterium thermoresistibile TaxID=1797 RepID=A0A100XGS3_MYCTH|nr:GK10133 [Mycolicibacterium thermoresistibile]SNW20260.1 Uncharacterised protein [Mycolicibacterium thermoresistibile]